MGRVISEMVVPDESGGVPGIMKGFGFAIAAMATVFLSGLVPAAAFAQENSVSSFGPGDPAWDNYYAHPNSQANWAPFCSGGGAKLVTSVQGVPACGPTPSQGGTKIYLPENGGPVVGFQCVELAERYLYVKYGWKPINQTNGAEVVQNYANQQHVSITVNDTSGKAPAVGDVMSFSKYPNFSGTGHTAIVSASSVDSSGNGTVTVIGENQNTVKGYNGFTAGAATMTVTGWAIKSFDPNTTHIEWLNNVSAAAQWSIQTIPHPSGPTYTTLNGVSCTSASACTAVGFYQTRSGESDRTLAEVWDGTSWTIQHTPNPSGPQAFLAGVSCISAGACTAVGYSGGGTLAEVWDGASWSIQRTPNPPGATGTRALVSVSCLSASACTAVGAYQTSSGYRTLAERWDGTSWRIQHTPNPFGSHNFLTGVSCTSASACTAVGYYHTRSGSPATLAERWNGTSWTVRHTPNPSGSKGGLLVGVSCTSASACTAVGSSATGTLAEAWNGTSWTIQNSPNPPGSQISLPSVSCSSANACTAVGYYKTRSGSHVTLAEAWNGTSWTVQHTPNPSGSTVSILQGVSCTSASVCTAVGEYTNKNGVSVVPLAEKESG